MSGRVVAHGPEAKHVCHPVGDRIGTYQLPPPPPLPSGKGGGSTPSVYTERFALRGDVYECGCGRTWVAAKRTVAHEWLRTPAGEWRRERWWERRRRQRKESR